MTAKRKLRDWNLTDWKMTEKRLTEFHGLENEYDGPYYVAKLIRLMCKMYKNSVYNACIISAVSMFGCVVLK